MGFDSASQSRSATTNAARLRSPSSASLRSTRQGKSSRSSSGSITAQIRSRVSPMGILDRVGSRPLSRRSTTDFATPASPTRRSRASGGSVAIRSTCITAGFCRRTSGVTLARSPVIAKACDTYSVALCLSLTNVFGAFAKYHALKSSTERRLSSPHLSGLSEFSRMCPQRSSDLGQYPDRPRVVGSGISRRSISFGSNFVRPPAYVLPSRVEAVSFRCFASPSITSTLNG